MNIVTFTVSGLQSYSSKFSSFDSMLDEFKADIICFQKTKLCRDKLNLKMTTLSNYHAFYNFAESKITNGGVATFCKKSSATPTSCKIGFYTSEYSNLDQEGRCLVTDHDDFLLFNIYFPTNGSKDRIVFKMWFFYVIQEQIEKLIKEGRNVLIACDLSFTHKPIDHYAPEGFLKPMGLKTFEEHRGRLWFSSLIDSDRFVDVFRFLYPEERAYTYWKNQMLKQSNCGLRLDYFVTNKVFAQSCVEDCKVMSVSGFGHAPIKLKLSIFQSFVPENPPEESALGFSEKLPSLNKYFPDVPAPVALKKQIAIKEEIKIHPDSVLCVHKEPAVLRETKKPGRNLGRPFYTCKRPPGHFKDPQARCQYFKWADEDIKVKCFHDKITILKKVKNDGRNSGKWYYCCRKITDDKCDFFKWAEEMNRAIEESVQNREEINT